MNPTIMHPLLLLLLERYVPLIVRHAERLLVAFMRSQLVMQTSPFSIKPLKSDHPATQHPTSFCCRVTGAWLELMERHRLSVCTQMRSAVSAHLRGRHHRQERQHVRGSWSPRPRKHGSAFCQHRSVCILKTITSTESCRTIPLLFSPFPTAEQDGGSSIGLQVGVLALNMWVLVCAGQLPSVLSGRLLGAEGPGLTVGVL